MTQVFNNQNIQFYTILILCCVIMYLPFIGKYIRLLNTVIHEAAHAFVALILRCKVDKINLFSNLEGCTYIYANKFKTTIIALMGYPMSAVAAFGIFALLKYNYANIYIITLCFLLFIALILYIRNAFGIVWIISFLALNIFLLYKGNIKIINFIVLIYACITFLESIISVFQIVILSIKDSKSAGDATIIAKHTHIPAFIVALVFLFVNLLINLYTIKLFFPFGDKIPFL